MKRWMVGALLWAVAAWVWADDIVRWQDADGQTHFGHASMAPESAEEVTLGHTNGMDKPVEVRLNRRTGRPNFIRLGTGEWRNRVGWRGQRGREQRRGSRR